jgi:hypothetical protein
VKSERSNGKFVSYDAAAQSIAIKEGGKQQTYQVKAEGTVLTRTTLTMNGKVAKFDDLKPGMIVIVYWKPERPTPRRNARKVDAEVPKASRRSHAGRKEAESGGRCRETFLFERERARARPPLILIKSPFAGRAGTATQGVPR